MPPAFQQQLRIIGTGLAVPPVVTNQNVIDMLPDLGIKMDWLDKNVGIKQRHISIDGMGVSKEEQEFLNKNNNPNNDATTSTSFKRPEFKNRTDLRSAPGCCNSDLCAKAIADAGHHATLLSSSQGDDEQFSLDQIDMVIVTTVTPDVPVPATATFVMEKLGLNNIQVMDIRSACCGFTIGLQNAIAYLQSSPSPRADDDEDESSTTSSSHLDIKTVAVVGCEVGSVYGNLDASHPKFSRGDAVNAAMIGDAASCVIIRRFDVPTTSNSSSSSSTLKHYKKPFGPELLHVETRCIGNGKEPGMHIPCGGCVHPFSQQVFQDGGHFFHHDFKKVLEHGAELYYNSIQNGLKALGQNARFQQVFFNNGNSSSSKIEKKNFKEPSIADIDLYIPHQANGRITSYGTKMGVEEDKLHEHFSTFGNTANASLAIGLYLESRRRVNNHNDNKNTSATGQQQQQDKQEKKKVATPTTPSSCSDGGEKEKDENTNNNTENTFVPPSSSTTGLKKDSIVSSSPLSPSSKFYSPAFLAWERLSNSKTPVLEDNAIVMCLAAESTKWLHGTICLLWHPMIPASDAAADQSGTGKVSKKTGKNAFSFARMKASLRFILIGWLLYYLKYITAVLEFLGIGGGGGHGGKKKKNKDTVKNKKDD